MNIGELNRRAEILEQKVTRDEYGGEEIEWVCTKKVWAKIEPNGGTEFLNAQQVQAENTTKITIRYNPTITVMHRIRYKEQLFEIIGVADSESGHRMTIITAKEMVSNELQCKAKKG